MQDFTNEEKQHLATLEAKLTHVRDAVRGIVKEFHTGLVLWGEGGTSKSYTVRQELERLNAKYLLHNSRLTGRGLVDVLFQAPHDLHVIEDAETLMDDRRAWGVLRSALHSQSRKKPMERPVTWQAHRTLIRFTFTGGIIIVSNANLAHSVPEIRAIKTRINVLRLDIANEEIRALMKRICMDGFTFGDDVITPDECWEVAQFLQASLAALQRPLDIRLLVDGGFKDFLQWASGNSTHHWHDLLLGRMKETVLNSYKSRAEVKDGEAQLAREIYALPMPMKDKVTLWREKTNLSRAAFYRALRRSA